MSASATPLLGFVISMQRYGVAPFRRGDHRLASLAGDLRQAAMAHDTQAVAAALRCIRLERLWVVEDWLMFRKQQHPRIAKWLRRELVAIGWGAK